MDDTEGQRPKRRRRAGLSQANVAASPTDEAPKPHAAMEIAFGSDRDTQLIAGTDMSVREQIVRETKEMLADYDNRDLDDREFAVRTIARQLVADPTPTVEEVRAWPEERLVAACRALLSFPPLKVWVDGVERVPDPDELTPIPDPLTFGAFREAVVTPTKRAREKTVELMGRIANLGADSFMKSRSDILDVFKGMQIDLPKTTGILDAVRAAQIDLPKIGPDPSLTAALESFRNSAALTAGLPKVGELNALVSRSLSDTAPIAASLARMQETNLAAKALASPIERPLPLASSVVTDFTPYHPEVEAIDALGDRVVEMADTYAKSNQQQIAALVSQAELVRAQGVALQAMLDELKAMRRDQRWPNRAVVVAAVLGAVLLVFAVITALPIITDFLRPPS